MSRSPGLAPGTDASSPSGRRFTAPPVDRPAPARVDRDGEGYAILVRNGDDAPPEGAAVTRDEARAWFTTFLLSRVRRDDYPSTTQLDLIEESIPREMLARYLRVLLEKVDGDMFPSVPLLYRIQQVIERLPHSGYGYRPSYARNDIETDEADAVAATASEEKADVQGTPRADEKDSQ